MSFSQTEVEKPLDEITTATEVDMEMRKAYAWNTVLRNHLCSGNPGRNA